MLYRDIARTNYLLLCFSLYLIFSLLLSLFIIYALFGVVITSSVSIAGVLQVFSYLIVPSVLANLWFTKVSHKLMFGWMVGFVVSAFGMSWSYLSDLPSGAAIVVCFTILPVLVVLFSSIFLPLKSTVAQKSR